MGQKYSHLFDKTEAQAKYKPTTNNEGEMIISYVDLTGLAVVEIQRFWHRFKQLGCDKNAMLSRKALEKGELYQDPFVRNIISNLPKEKDGSLSFVVFLKFFHWIDSADEEIKLRVLFNFLNNGQDIDKDIAYKLLRRLYTSYTEDELTSVSVVFLSQLDPDNIGRINEDMFVNNIRRIYSIKELNKYLKIDIIPSEILDEINMEKSIHGSMMSVRTGNNDFDNSSELTDALLDQVATKAYKKDWRKLASILGFLDSDVRAFKSKNKSDESEALFEMLREWRDQDPPLATKNRLRRYLDDCNLKEAAAVLR